ncbi:acyltransferase [Plebeiibacterium sediminum]|uniref:Acyltransferase family protein n=1 Tax=Plebeiibacterium sediminum TaxID=2992112 RepID=A0AAE3M427_9BACT|nr:acyltransferase family protein [Plebeiobacterium sediminum]MCW3786636.1 acyltransferase family protein [Plebeiobacterium sediminum]
MKRINSVDFMRVVAIIFVIAIHTNPFLPNAFDNSQGNIYLFGLINQLARFAVPFFFVISGYFYSVKINKSNSIESTTKKMALRIAIIWIFWNLIYLFPFYKFYSLLDAGVLEMGNNVLERISYYISHPKILLLEGTSIHLWFLSSLFFSILTTSIFIKFNLNKSLITIAIFLYIIGVLAKAYINTPLGINLHFDTRNSLFLGLIFFVSGYKIASFTPKTKWLKIGFVIFILGLFFHFLEIFILKKYYNTSGNQDYVFATYFMGLGIAIISLSNQNFFNIPFFNYVGQKTLGIYAIHVLLIPILKPFFIKYYHPIFEIGFPIIIYFISLVFVEVLSRNRMLSQILT